MKNHFFGSAAVALVLAVAAVSCTPIQQSSGDSGYYENPPVSSAPSRVWVDDPYRPGNTILMERDPFTGRYYPVAGNSAYGSYSSPYGSTYRDPYNRNTRPRYNRPNGNRPYRNGQVAQPTPRQQEQYRREGAERRSQAADAILGRRQ